MEVQEKINELVQRFSQHIIPHNDNKMLSKTHLDDATLWQAKKCALITVNEILETTPMYIGILNPRWKFWNEVKMELEEWLNNAFVHGVVLR